MFLPLLVMGIFTKKTFTWQLQVFIWLIVFILSLMTNIQYDGFLESVTYSMMVIVFYPIIIYGNAYWLLTAYYYRKKYLMYVVFVVFLLGVTIVLRTLVVYYLYNTFFAVKHLALSAGLFIYTSFTFLVIFLVSILFRLAIDYFVLTEKQAEIETAQMLSELNLLKQQVQPHFLFNTLNNIYYVAHSDSSESAELIARLSGIIRYFMEESKKEKVYLSDEVNLLKSYIDLENIRMRYKMPTDFIIKGNMDDILVPPLLLMPLAENIYKHGIDKRSKENFAHIRLIVANDYLSFSTRNRYYGPQLDQQTTRTGLVNLEKRLNLYYGKNYNFVTTVDQDVFITNLKIPLNENQLYFDR